MMLRRFCTGLVACALVVPQAGYAQFGGLSFGSKKKTAAESTTSTGCTEEKKKSSGAAMFGRALGSIGGGMMRRSTGFARFVPVQAFANMLSDAIACRLDEKEQKQAATATTEAVRGEKVGSTVAWKSDTREGVTGTSTVKQQIASADGSKCMLVADVIIVNGEETKVDKKMCRKPGASGYVLSA